MTPVLKSRMAKNRAKRIAVRTAVGKSFGKDIVFPVWILALSGGSMGSLLVKKNCVVIRLCD